MPAERSMVADGAGVTPLNGEIRWATLPRQP
jgi:hypothetical protein